MSVTSTCVVHVRSSKTDIAQKYPSFEGVLYKARNAAQPNELTYTSEELQKLDLRGEPIYVEHDQKLGSVGVIVENRFEDPYLVIVGSINTKNRELRETIREHLKNGKLRDLSIGFKAVQNTRTGEFSKKEFVEGSLVEQGYYDETKIISVCASGKQESVQRETAERKEDSGAESAVGFLLQEKLAAQTNLEVVEKSGKNFASSNQKNGSDGVEGGAEKNVQKISPNSYLTNKNFVTSTTTGEKNNNFFPSSSLVPPTSSTKPNSPFPTSNAMEVDPQQQQQQATQESTESMDTSSSTSSVGATIQPTATGAASSQAQQQTSAPATTSTSAPPMGQREAAELEMYRKMNRERSKPWVDSMKATAKKAGVAPEVESVVEELGYNPEFAPVRSIIEFTQNENLEMARKLEQLTREHRELKRKYAPSTETAANAAQTVAVASSLNTNVGTGSKQNAIQQQQQLQQLQQQQKRARIPSPAAEPVPVRNNMLENLRSIVNRTNGAAKSPAPYQQQQQTRLTAPTGAASYGNQTVMSINEDAAAAMEDDNSAVEHSSEAVNDGMVHAPASSSHSQMVGVASSAVPQNQRTANDYLADNYIRPIHQEVYAHCSAKTRNEQILKEQESRSFFKHSLSNVYLPTPEGPRPILWDMCLKATVGQLPTTPIQLRIPSGARLSSVSSAFGMSVQNSEAMGY
jgi:hypothetical protein